MSNKTCGGCKHCNIAMFHCEKFDCCAGEKEHCEDFEPKNPPTNGDVIRQGGNDALIDFASGIRRRMCHYCAFSKHESCVDKTGDCWEGVRAWLNAPAESEGEDE